MGDQLRDYLPDATKKDMVRFLTTACGARVPEIFKKATEHGCVVERTPPYVPEPQPIELVRNCLKTAYNTRYDNSTPVSGFLVDFF